MQGGRNALHLCIWGCHLAVAQYLAPKMGDHLYDTDDNGTTALHWAVEMKQLSIVEYLVGSCGFDVTVRDKVCRSTFVKLFNGLLNSFIVWQSNPLQP